MMTETDLAVVPQVLDVFVTDLAATCRRQVADFIQNLSKIE